MLVIDLAKDYPEEITLYLRAKHGSMQFVLLGGGGGGGWGDSDFFPLTTLKTSFFMKLPLMIRE